MKSNSAFLLFSGFAFVALLVLVSICNRFAADDFYWIDSVRTFGAIGSASELYETASGRWTSGLLLGGMFAMLSSWEFLIPVFNLVFISIFCMAVYKLVSVTTSDYSDSHQSLSIKELAFVFVLMAFFMTSGNGEIWFWINALPQYLLGISTAIVVSFIILRGKSTWSSIIAVALLSLYTGGAAEATSGTFFYLFLVAVLYFKKEQRKLALIALIALTVGIIINVLAPGNDIRMSWLPQRSLFSGIEMTLKSIYHLIFDQYLNLILALLFSITWFLGREIKLTHPVLQWTKRRFNLFTVVLMLGALLSLFIPSYVLSDVAPKRTYLLPCLLGAAWYYALSVRIAGRYQFNDGQRSTLRRISGYLIAGTVIFNCIQGIPAAFVYSKAYDTRMATIVKHTAQPGDSIFELEPLPPSGMIFSAEISPDINHWTNKQLRQGMKLDYHVVRKK